MAFYRIFALIRKDLDWIRGNKKLLMYASTSFLIFFIVIIFTDLVYSSLLEENSSAEEIKMMEMMEIIIKQMLLLVAVLPLGIFWTSDLIVQEKDKGTFLALLTTPLRYYEFVLGKLFISFSALCSLSLLALFLDFFINKKSLIISLSLSPFIVVNVILVSATLCLVGLICGLFVNTNLEQQKLVGFLIMCFMLLGMVGIFVDIPGVAASIPFLQKFSSFNPFFHFLQAFGVTEWPTLLMHIGFNTLFFTGFLFFSYFYTKFYFSNSREKRFSLKLLMGLGGVIGLYLLSGLVTSVLIKKNYENIALMELKMRIMNNQSLNVAKWTVPLEDFFKNSEISNVRLSSNGKYLAYLKPFQNRMNIHVRKVDDINSEKRITNQTKRDITGFGWKENDTLIFLKDSGGDENFHVFSVSITGENEKNLTPFKNTKVIISNWLEGISEDHILIGTNQRVKTVFDIYRLNVKTGDIQLVVKNPGNLTSYLTDHEGKLRVATSTDGVNTSVYYRETEKEEFQKIITTDFKDSFAPVMFTFDNKNLYVSSNIDRDKVAFEIFDPRQKKVLSTVFSHPEVDVSTLVYSKKRKVLVAALYMTWKTEIHFFDSVYRNIFQYLRSNFPNTEISFVSMNRNEDLIVVFVHSDRKPGSYYLYNVNNNNLKKLADPRPWIKEENMVEDRPIQYISRDGLTIHGYLSLPKGNHGKNLPVVVNPHGGPWARNTWGYNPEGQFLASRGYAVFQMNFRGSIGYGKKFWMAGFKQWGRKMQDDITDGVQYLIDEGIADKNRIAIYGGSYGGYAALAGLAFTPDLYACGVSYVGVSNLFTFINSIPSYWEPLRKQLYEQIGHPEEDKELLKAISPFFHADKIKAPLFVAQGARDPRVKKSESDQIVRALEKRGVKVPYLVKSNEGHGFQNEENRMEFYRLMEVFLESCLK